jgi:hypothetical protein
MRQKSDNTWIYTLHLAPSRRGRLEESVLFPTRFGFDAFAGPGAGWHAGADVPGTFPLATFFVETFLPQMPPPVRRAWTRLARRYAEDHAPSPALLRRCGLAPDVAKRITPALPRAGHEDGRAAVAVPFVTDAIGCAWLSLYLGVRLGRLRFCSHPRCRAPFLLDPKHPREARCRRCRRRREFWRDWLPDALRPAFARLRTALDQRVSRGTLTKARRKALLAQARADAEQARAGRLAVDECVARWQRIAPHRHSATDRGRLAMKP